MKREHTNTAFRLLARVEVIWAAIAIISLTLTFVVLKLSRTDHNTCVQVQAINAQISVTLHRSLSSLPTITYYRMHPDEMAKALRQTRDSIEVFRPRVCP